MQTISEMIDLLDTKRKERRMTWHELYMRSGVPKSTMYFWKINRKSPFLPNYIAAMRGARCRVELMDKDGYVYPLLTTDGFINTNSLSVIAKKQGTNLFKTLNKTGQPNGSIYAWRTGEVWPRMDTFLHVLNQIQARLVVIDVGA